jgi:hypothetical protein
VASSRIPGPVGLDGLYGGICPAQTPGPLGLNDQADPNVFSFLGDTPGPLGINDYADPDLRGAIKLPIGVGSSLVLADHMWQQALKMAPYEQELRQERNPQPGAGPKAGQTSTPGATGGKSAHSLLPKAGTDASILTQPNGPKGSTTPKLSAFESPWYLQWVPGQHFYDMGITSLRNGQYGWAAVHFVGMITEQVLTVLTLGEASLIKQGTRSLRLPAIDNSLAGTRTLGYTTPNGKVFLRPGLSRAEQVSTLRHESVHAFLSPRGSGPVAIFRQHLGQWGYDNSQLLRFTEEAIAETYGSGSLIEGLLHPLVNGYDITVGGLLLEAGALGGAVFGPSYLANHLHGGK